MPYCAKLYCFRQATHAAVYDREDIFVASHNVLPSDADTVGMHCSGVSQEAITRLFFATSGTALIGIAGPLLVLLLHPC
jgi:hypothetical protein